LPRPTAGNFCHKSQGHDGFYLAKKLMKNKASSPATRLPLRHGMKGISHMKIIILGAGQVGGSLGRRTGQ